jgi:predicted nucleic acid-binding protein
LASEQAESWRAMETQTLETEISSAQASFDQRVSRLAQYRPFDDGGLGQRACLRDLTIVAAMENGGHFDSLADCREGFDVLWEYEVEIDEIRFVVDALVEEGEAVRKGGGFGLAASSMARLRKISQESLEIEAKAFDGWRTRLKEQWPKLSSEDFDLLCHDFPAWLGQVVARHGSEAALLVYTDNPRAHVLFDRIDAMGLDFLPTREGLVAEIRERAFQMFVREAGAEQRTYLARRLNIGFYLTVLTLDPTGGELIRKKVNGHRVYLDTNFLYAVLGMAKASEVYSAARLLELTQGMGFELAVTSWTVRELLTSMAKSRKDLERSALPRRELANLMLKGAGEKGFERAFWMHYRDKGTKPKDFFDRVSHIDALLKEHAIQKVNTSCGAIDSQQEAIGQQVVLYDRSMSSQDKEDLVVEHDVKHRLLIEQLRGDGNLSFTNARYWFLTQHARLMRYGSVDLQGEVVRLPFCVTTSAWAQAIRFLTPRTEDVDQMIVDLFSSPYVGYGTPVNPTVVDAVVSRIDEFADADIELGAEVLADNALVSKIGLAKTAEEASEQVKRALDVKGQDLRDQAESGAQRELEAARQLQDADELAAVAIANAERADNARKETERRLREAHAAHRETERALNERLESERQEWESHLEKALLATESEKSQRQNIKQRVNALEEKERLRAKRLRFLVSAVIVMATGIAAVLVVAIGIVGGAWPITGVVVASVALVWFALILSRGRERARAAILTSCCIVGGVMALYAAVAAVLGHG